MIGLDLVQLFENGRSLELVAIGLVRRQRRLIHRQRIKRGGLEIVRIFRGDLLHRLFVGEGPGAVIELVGIFVEEHHRIDVRPLAVALRADPLRGFSRGESVLQSLRRAQAGERVAPGRQRDAPLRDAAR